MERKLATVLFADLVESTQLVSASDPEIVRRRVTRFFEQVARCIETHGGTVEKFAGDAVMAAFGIPRAHEDDAERAIRAALGIMESVDDLGVAPADELRRLHEVGEEDGGELPLHPQSLRIGGAAPAGAAPRSCLCYPMPTDARGTFASTCCW